MHYRTIFISDVHLGTRGCSDLELLDFLKNNDADKIYIIGDFIDGWSLFNKVYWPQPHNDIIQKLFRKSRKGTIIEYIPGNHDEFLRPYVGNNMGNIHILMESTHVTVDGRKLLIVHGDKFDGVILKCKWLAHLGSRLYDFSIDANRIFNFVRRQFGYEYWSLSAYLKHKVKDAVSFINKYENTVAKYCKERGYDGVVCGHIHSGEIKYIDDVLYMNTSDWVESRGCIVELYDGTFQYMKFESFGNYIIKSKVNVKGEIELFDISI
jgi:UDP-2,3-diacylglucosamine pyrophosphatase LpxH